MLWLIKAEICSHYHGEYCW